MSTPSYMRSYTSESPERSRSKTEHVFIVGNDIGQGTQGLGEERCRAASTDLYKTYMKSYWENRGRQGAEQKRKENERLRKIEMEQAGSPRQRMQAAMGRRQKEIEEMTAERKAFERKFKEDQKKEQEIRNEIIHRDKELVKKQLEEAKEQREVAKERYLVKLRKDRAEALRVRELEADAEKLQAEEHYTKMRQIHEVWKARAEEEKRRAYEKRCEEVKEKKKKQIERVKRSEVDKKEIVNCKGELIVKMKSHMSRLRSNVEAKREDILTKNAAHHREEVKERAQIRKKADEEFIEHKKIEAKQKKEAAAEARVEYRAGKERKFEELRREAKELKEMVKAEMDAEKEEQRQAHQEYISLMKQLVDRRGGGSKSASGSPNRSHSGAPKPMSPSKLASY